MGYRYIDGKLYPVGSIQNVNNQITKVKKQNIKSDFNEILNKKLESEDSFVISKHALKRIEDRDIKLDKTDMKKINDGINAAEKKGSKDCLILYKDIALVTSIKNRTVITALHKDETQNNVFTNIDSALIL